MDSSPGTAGFNCSLTPAESALARELRKRVYEKAGKSEIKSAVFDFAFAVISNKREDINERFKDPFVQFLIGSSLQSDDSFKQPGDITRIVAALQYNFRLIVLKFCIDTSEREGRGLLQWVSTHVPKPLR